MSSILIVEDDFEMNTLMALTLRMEKYEVLQAYAGEEALTLAAEHQPDLILLDVMLPRMTGYEIAKTLHQQEATAHIPIIFVTARQDLDDLVQGLEWAVDYISKPFAVPELMARVRTALRMKKLQEELRASRDELAQLAITDPLTGLLNRRGFSPQVEDELWRAQRFGQPLSVLIFDLDHFKRVNDNWLHPQGDKVLQAFAEVLSHSTRRIDRAARLGGEEFSMLLPATDEDGARQVAENVRRATARLRIPVKANDKEGIVSITVSGGAATVDLIPPEFDQIGALAAQLIEAADANLYEAKNSGRDRVVARSIPSSQLTQLTPTDNDLQTVV